MSGIEEVGIMLKVCINRDPVLRKISKPLKEISHQDKKLFKKMLRFIHKEKGIGLAAVQVGILKQMIVVNIGEEFLQLANPKIVKKIGKKNSRDEGCLSLPGIVVDVKRYPKIWVEAIDVSGRAVKIEASNLLARVLQHEIDHLNGRLIIDYLPWHKRMIVKRKLA